MLARSVRWQISSAVREASNQALNDAAKPTPENAKTTKETATALVNGVEVKRDINGFGEIKLADKPKFLIAIAPDTSATAVNASASVPPGTPEASKFGVQNPLELTITPGETMQIEFMIFDVSDTVLDSLTLLDNFQWGLATATVNTHE